LVVQHIDRELAAETCIQEGYGSTTRNVFEPVCMDRHGDRAHHNHEDGDGSQ
jgi:hypothetical protein